MSGLVRRARRGAAPAAKRVLFGLGAYGVIRSIRPSRKLAILRYHAVCGPEGHAYAEPAICVSPEAFDAHVAYLTSRYRVLPLPAAVHALRHGTRCRPTPWRSPSTTGMQTTWRRRACCTGTEPRQPSTSRRAA
jgi:hypothetical protein